MAKVLVAPNGLQIQGTVERVPGAGLMTNIRLEDGKIALRLRRRNQDVVGGAAPGR